MINPVLHPTPFTQVYLKLAFKGEHKNSKSPNSGFKICKMTAGILENTYQSGLRHPERSSRSILELGRRCFLPQDFLQLWEL
jgi:hypothetical protein